MDELEFYDGAYSGAEIDAAIAKITENCNDLTVTDASGGKLSNLTGKATKVGNMVVFAFQATAAQAFTGTGSEEVVRITGVSPSVSGQIVTVFEQYVAKSARVNGGTNMARMFLNSGNTIASGKAVSASGVIFL